jgi:LytS/YehU family sensor histidine kinase
MSAGAGRVEVRAFRDGGRLRIEVFNTGALTGAPAYGIGLRNTTERLAQLYGDQQSFALRNDGGGVLASLAIPWSEVA